MIMGKTKLFLIGAGGHASSCIDLIEETEKFRIVGIIGKNNELGTYVQGYEVIGTDLNIESLRKITKNVVLGIGQIKSPKTRMEVSDLFVKNGFSFKSVFSSTSRISKNAQIDEGTVVMHNVTINTGVKIGKYSIINTGAILEHGAAVGDYAHVSTGVIVNGESRVGKGTFVGSGTVIKELTIIGDNCLIGMGQFVRKNLPDNSRYIG
jgi:sugar O-acyltransferase (sialic acid O-acetyltransferase NeuD family)